MVAFIKDKFKYILAVLIILILIALVVFIPLIRDLTAVIFISFIIAYSLKPFVSMLERKGLNKKISSIMVITVIVLFFILTIIILVPSIYKESDNIFKAVDEFKEYVKDFSNETLKFTNNDIIKGLMNSVYAKVKTWGFSMVTTTLDSLVNITEKAVYIFIIPPVIYFFLSDGDTILNGIIRFVPMEKRAMVLRGIKHIDKVLERYIVTQFELCAIVGVLTYIIVLFSGIKFGFILSIINAIFNIIPYFGPLIGGVPIVLFASLTSFKKAIILVIWLNVVQQIEGNIVSPKIIADSVSAHPLTILILLVVGGEVGGIIGMIIIVPVWVVLKIIFYEIQYYLF